MAVPGHPAEDHLVGGHRAEGHPVEDHQEHRGINLLLKLPLLLGPLVQPGEPSNNVRPARKKLRNLPLLPNPSLDPLRSLRGPSGNVGVHDLSASLHLLTVFLQPTTDMYQLPRRQSPSCLFHPEPLDYSGLVLVNPSNNDLTTLTDLHELILLTTTFHLCPRHLHFFCLSTPFHSHALLRITNQVLLVCSVSLHLYHILCRIHLSCSYVPSIYSIILPAVLRRGISYNNTLFSIRKREDENARILIGGPGM
jgi:hypothetical protein